LSWPEEGNESRSLLNVVYLMIVAEAAVLLRRSYLEDDVSSKSLLG